MVVGLPPSNIRPEDFAWGDFAVWSAVLIAASLIGLVIILWAKRALRPDDEEQPDGFTLHGLRQLHRDGELNDDEFERAKAALIERIKGREELPEPDKNSDTDGTE